MAKKLTVMVKPKTKLVKEVPQSLFARLKYTREVPSEDPDDAAPKTVNLLGSRREELDADGEVTISVDDYADATIVTLQIELAQGSILFVSDDLTPSTATPADLKVVIPDDVYAAATQRVVPVGDSAVLVRAGRYVRLDDAMLDVSGHRLYVAPIRPNQLPGGGTNPQTDVVRALLGLSGTGEVTTFEAVQLDLAKLVAKSVNALGLQSATVHSDGAFDVSVDITGDEIAWLWLLLGSINYAGYQLDPVPTQPRANVVIVLPQPTASSSSSTVPVTSTAGSGTPGAPDTDEGHRPPLDFDERQLVDHPDRFSDDPGGTCTPFENPHRILGERRFFTVLRVDQPEIGGQGSLKVSRPISLDLVPPIRLTAVSAELNRGDSISFGSRPTIATHTSAMRASLASTVQPRLDLRATLDRSVFRPSMDFWRKWVRDGSKEREPVSGNNPIEWEGDPSIYQAASVAGGHVLEWRVRWRSNGYSLGNVAHTLTLAPRQTKRISKISWRRREEAARREVTEVSDALTQVTKRSRDYTDAVQSSLSEWAHGQSQSRTTGVAGGLGFALGPVVIGGGAAHGRASSSSSQSGGRRVAASEHQQLRDAIRQYGEATRRLESTVITEVTQEEEVEGVAETLRNINYSHALTVMYYEIHRHLRVDTEFAGLRECLFVPFSITPFDVDKALKWREQLKQGMLDRSLRWALDYLDEVDSAWVNSSIPAGPRMDQQINYLTGSIYVQLSIERPREIAPEEQLEAYYAIWSPLAPILGMPVKRIVERLTSIERDKDAFYQREVAPTMAARWADRLELRVAGRVVDFTLASGYRFGSTVRIDFTAPVSGVNRSQLQNFALLATQPLPVGSVANVKSMTLHYYTDHYNRRVESVPTTDDLIDPATGQPNSGGNLHVPITPWEAQDQRREIEDAVERLITHINSNLVYYHKVIWWLMDRDELYMLLDGFTAPYGRRFENGAWVEDAGRSIASVVERDPMAILGNTLVMRVGAGAFLGIDGHDSPVAAHRHYYDSQVRTEPLRVSLPTEGLYAQALMDKCEAAEEHRGSTDWVLTDGEPELETLADQLGTRRQVPADLTPTQMPQSIINLQNAPVAPDPTGLAGVLQAVTTSNAFRDMAGLAGTQANAMGALTQAASLAQSFGQMAVDFQKSKQGTADAKQKLSNIEKAKSAGLIDDAEAKRQSARALDDQNMTSKPKSITTAEEVEKITKTAGANRADVSVKRPDGETVEARTLPQALGAVSTTWVDLNGNTPSNRTFSPDTNDKTGISRLQAAISNAPPGAKFQWTVNNPNKLRFSHPNAGASDILAGESGITTVSFEVQDASGNTLRIGHVWVGVPKFIVVREFAGPAYTSHRGGVANSHLLDTVLSEFHLTAQKTALLQTAKLVCDYLLRGANVRTIWELSSFGEVLPKQFQPGEFAETHLSPLEIAGFAPTTRFGSPRSASQVGITHTTRAGAILPTQGQIEVYPGGLDSGIFPEVSLILDEVIRLEGEVAAQPGNAALAQELARVQDLWTEVVGRVLGMSMAHEIYHLLLADSPGLTNGHTTAPEIDLLSPGSALTFKQWTGVEVPHPRPATFPAQGTFTDRGYSGLAVLGEANQSRVDALFPVPPAFPFS